VEVANARIFIFCYSRNYFSKKINFMPIYD
jgi:hypothetical protein